MQDNFFKIAIYVCMFLKLLSSRNFETQDIQIVRIFYVPYCIFYTLDNFYVLCLLITMTFTRSGEEMQMMLNAYYNRGV